MPFITVGESRIYYECHGAGSAVLLAHGVGGNHASWFNQVPPLSEKYRVVVFDHRGFGNSTDIEGAGRDGFVDDIARLVEHLQIDKTVLIGQSMGAGASAAFASRFPKRVRALIHCDSLAGVQLDEPFATELEALRVQTRALVQQERVLGRTTLTTDPARTFLYLQIASFNSANLNNVRGQSPSWTPHQLAISGVPVLFVVGEEDVICPPKFVQHIHRQIPNSEFAMVRRAGHSAYFEQPQAFNQILSDYLDALDPRW